MPYLELKNHKRLFYLDINPDVEDAVVLLHGLGVDSSSWVFQIPILASAGFRVLAPDSPGFGQSDAPGQTKSIRDLTRFIPEMLDQLSIDHPSFVGISMGGTQALQFAIDYLDTLKKLVLVNTFARLEFTNPTVWPYYAARFILVHTLGLSVQARMVAMRIFPLPEQENLRHTMIQQIIQTRPHHYRSTIRALAAFNVESDLGRIRTPALVITGDRDTTVPVKIQSRLAAHLPDAQHVTIPGAGHAVSVECPNIFNQTLINFLCG